MPKFKINRKGQPDTVATPTVQIHVEAEPFVGDPEATCWVARVRVRQFHGEWVTVYGCMGFRRHDIKLKARAWAKSTLPGRVVEEFGFQSQEDGSCWY